MTRRTSTSVRNEEAAGSGRRQPARATFSSGIEGTQVRSPAAGGSTGRSVTLMFGRNRRPNLNLGRHDAAAPRGGHRRPRGLGRASNEGPRPVGSRAGRRRRWRRARWADAGKSAGGRWAAGLRRGRGRQAAPGRPLRPGGSLGSAERLRSAHRGGISSTARTAPRQDGDVTPLGAAFRIPFRAGGRRVDVAPPPERPQPAEARRHPRSDRRPQKPGGGRAAGG